MCGLKGFTMKESICNKCGLINEVKEGVNGKCSSCENEYSWSVLWGTPDLEWLISWDEVI